jgi:hypothetical protein
VLVLDAAFSFFLHEFPLFEDDDEHEEEYEFVVIPVIVLVVVLVLVLGSLSGTRIKNICFSTKSTSTRRS